MLRNEMASDDEPGSRSYADAGEDDATLPKATVFKLITEHLPPGVACTKESRELLADCCVEFIHLLASEANDVCEKASRKTITPGDVMAAVEALGFGGYRPEMEAAMEASQAQVDKDRERSRAGNKLETSGLTEEELVRQQEELFAAARRKFLDAQSAGK